MNPVEKALSRKPAETLKPEARGLDTGHRRFRSRCALPAGNRALAVFLFGGRNEVNQIFKEGCRACWKRNKTKS